MYCRVTGAATVRQARAAGVTVAVAATGAAVGEATAAVPAATAAVAAAMAAVATAAVAAATVAVAVVAVGGPGAHATSAVRQDIGAGTAQRPAGGLTEPIEALMPPRKL